MVAISTKLLITLLRARIKYTGKVMTFFGYSRMMNEFLNFVWNGVFNLTGIDLSFDIRYRDYSFYLVELKADHNAVKKDLKI